MHYLQIKVQKITKILVCATITVKAHTILQILRPIIKILLHKALEIKVLVIVEIII